MPPQTDPDAAPKLVLVTGSGRSGTSTVSGTLKMLGCYVPQPEVKADSSNPRGFFEPRWAVDFHKEVLKLAGVRTLDARPEALDLMSEVTSREDLRTELRDWFSTQLNGPQIIVKDPRIFWLRTLWVQAATDLGVRPTVLTMLRHPAEVVGSREMHYLKKADADRRLVRETANLAGWVNVALTNERVSRGDQRTFVRYTDLISDWRTTMARVAEQLDLTYDYDVASTEHHEVDDFIDVTLRRAQLTWDDIDVPEQLRDVAETVWQALDVLVRDPHDTDAMTTLDAMRTQYDQLHSHAVALTQDHTNSEVQAARRQARRRMAKSLQQAAPQPTPSLPRRIVRKVRAVRGAR
jgi:hypothetical protein